MRNTGHDIVSSIVGPTFSNLEISIIHRAKIYDYLVYAGSGTLKINI